MTDQSEEINQEAAQKEPETEPQIASQLEYYASVIGVFKDDPMLDAMMANIRARRREMDADDNIT